MIDLNNYTVNDCAGEQCENTDLIAALDDNLKAVIAENKRLKAELEKVQGEFKGVVYLNSVQRDQMKSMEEEMQNYAGCLARARAELEQLKEANRWIPVKERLPTKSTTDLGEEYLVFVKGWIGDPGFVCPMNFDADNDGEPEWYTGGFSTTRLRWNHRVACWRPLPEFKEVDHAES